MTTTLPTPGTRNPKLNAFKNTIRFPTMYAVFYVIAVIVVCPKKFVTGQSTSPNNAMSMISAEDYNSTGEVIDELVSDDVLANTGISSLQSNTEYHATATPSNKAVSTILGGSITTVKQESAAMPPVIVRDEAPVLNKEPNNETVQIGRRITLQCRASGNPTPDIIWEKDGHVIPRSAKHFVIKENHNLRIVSASLEDAGQYRCRATNRVNTIESRAAYIVVEMRVTIKSGPGIHNVTYGTIVNLTCNIDGFPKPDIVWLKQGGTIHDSMGKRFLVINATTSANYTCLASNNPRTFEESQVRAMGQVIVRGRPNYCAAYNGLVCHSILGTKRIFYNASLLDPPGKLERTIQDLITQAKNSVLVSKPCQKALESLVCHQAYPDCEEIKGVPPKPKPLSKEDCRVVKDSICRNDLAKLRNTKNQMILWGSGDGNLGLPECDDLPRKIRPDVAFTDVQLFPEVVDNEVTKECLFGNGHYYMGTVNTTKDGILCQPWEAQQPQSHLFYPGVYPELRNSSNYCRNPGGLSKNGAWCFTLNRDITWDYCDIPICGDSDSNTKPSVTNNPRGIIQTVNEEDVQPVPKGLSPTTMITIICVVTAGSICILVIACFARRRYKYIKRFANYKYPVFDPNRLPENPLFGKDLSRSYNPKLQYLEYPRNDIVYMRDIGEGAFGRVFQAITPHLMREEEKTVVAIKMLKTDAERDVCDYFNREAEIISRFNHRNIIQLLGICFVGKPLCLILEYMGQGDLQEFLQSHHPYSSHKRIKNAWPKYTINNKVQLEMAQQVACGLVYLTEKRFLHRDMATRNCLVNNNVDVKISDFGLAQYLGENNEYVGNKDETIPIRWTAPEALWQYHFTTFSDVWSFGVLLWEIFSYAQQPYASLSHEQVFIQTHQGHTLSKPSNTPSSVYDLMRRCWALDRTQRPTFHTVVDTLNQIKEEIEASPESSSPSTSVVSIESSSES